MKFKKIAPIQIAFDVTTNCNLRCVHCFNNSGSEAPFKDMSKEEKLDIARQIADMHPINVCLCGGETTCCSFLFEIIDILSPKVGKVSMVSNGFLMTESLAAELKEHGVSTVQISVDGLYAWQHDSFRGVQGSFDRAVNALRCLKKVNMKEIDTSLVPNRLNYRSLEAYTAMVYELGATDIRMMPFLPSGRGVTVGSHLMLNAEEYLVFMRSVARVKKEYQGKINILWGDPLDHMRRMPMNANMGITTYVLEIKTNGDLTVTSYLPVTAGNCTRHTLQEYWDAGYDNVWGNPCYTQYTDKIRNIYDLAEFEPQPFTGEKIVLDLLAAEEKGEKDGKLG